MSWSAEFCAGLRERARRPLFRLRDLQIYAEPSNSYMVGSTDQVGSDPGLTIAEQGVSIQGQTLDPWGPWTSTIGAFSVILRGDPSLLRERLTRGSGVQVECTLDGGATWERIAVGTIANLRGWGPTYTLECRDILGALQSRMDPTAYSTMTLFYALHSTTLTADSAVADGTYDVSSAAAWQKETGGYGAMLVTPAAGDPYYRLWSATTATTVTIQSPGTAALMDTTDVGAANGDAAQEVVYLSGHPLDIARKVLVSRGSGANGAYDTLPAHCGLGVTDSILDHDEIDAWRSSVVVVSSGSYSWQVAVAEEQTDAAAWLTGLLSPSGLFLAMRQGSIVIRAAQAMESGALPDAYILDDSEIGEILEVEHWAADDATEYAGLRVTTASGGGASTYTAPATLPAAEIIEQDIAPMVSSNTTAIGNEVAARCGPWWTRIATRIRVQTVHLGAAELCIGDAVRIDTVRIQGHPQLGYGAAPLVMVDEVAVDWYTGTVSVGMLLLPDTEETLP